MEPRSPTPSATTSGPDPDETRESMRRADAANGEPQAIDDDAPEIPPDSDSPGAGIERDDTPPEPNEPA